MAPFDVAVVLLDPTDADVVKAGDQVEKQLSTAGLEVLIDDRQERPGVKFRDVELVGIPYRITLGSRIW